jgi:Flp pilus assembly protein TadD
VKDAKRRHAVTVIHYFGLAESSLRAPALHRLAVVVAVLLAGLLYVNALDNPFVYDDRRLVVENRSLRPPLNLAAILLHEVTRPAVNLSYAIDRSLWGPAPFGFHVTNVLLHMLNVALLFAFCRRATGRRLAAFIAASLLAVHPLMTQAVGYVSGRAEVLCTTFFLLALMAARRWMLGGRRGWLAATFGLWLLALASKETAVMFVVVLAYDRLLLSGSAADRRRRLLWLHAPIVGFAAFVVTLRLVVFAFVEHPGQLHTDWRFALLEVDVVRRYLGLLFTPGGQTIFHELAPVTGWLDARVLGGLGLLGLLGAIAWWMRRVEGMVTVGILWFVMALVPPAALVVMGRGEPMAEQRAYLASCGLFLAFGTLVARLEALRNWNSRPFAKFLYRGIVTAVLAILSMHTLLRNAVWDDPVTLFSEAIDKAPDSWHAQLLLGEALHDAGRHDEAIGAFTTALASRPEEPAIYPKLGLCLIEVGQLKQAAAAFEKLRQLAPRSPDGSNGLGALALLAGQPEEARSLYEETLLYDPWNVPARAGLARVEELQGNAAAALRRCQEIKALAPETPGNEECLSRNRARSGGGDRPR